MKKGFWLFLVFIFSALFLSGCKKVFTCPYDFLVKPVPSSPTDYAIVASLSPTLSWTFPSVAYPYSSTTSICVPEKYSVVLAKGPFYNTNLGAVVDGSINSFTPGSNLEAGRTYRWIIWPKSEGKTGPASGGRTFFTGDLCDPASLVAPLPAMPYNGEEVKDLQPSLVWEYPENCRVESYQIDLSASATFTGVNLGGTTGNSDTRWGPASILKDCTRYYWRVTPAVSSTLGPTSAVFTFRTNSGTCGPDGGVPGYTISGEVWQDLCSASETGPVPSPMPLGCVANTLGGASANGVLDPGEPGINNVLVRLGAGTCPSTDKGVTFTDENGMFSFAGIPGGDYCVSIDAGENVEFLLPGNWTHPTTSIPNAALDYINVTVPDGDESFNNDFGWQFKQSKAISYSTVSGNVWNDLCVNTSPSYSGTPASNCVKSVWNEVYANGIHDKGEPGLSGVTVKAFSGNCGSTSPITLLASTKTDSNGDYHFLLPLYGSFTDYCISIDAADSDNASIFGAGIWTHKLLPFGNYHMWENVQIHGGEAKTLDWGWDFMEKPGIMVPGPSATPIPFPHLTIPGNAYCYEGPNFSYKAFAKIGGGTEFSILGTDPTGQWFLIDPDETYTIPTNPNATPTPVSPVRCWVPRRDAQPDGDLGGLGVFTGPRFTPTPTIVPISCSGLSKEKCQQVSGCNWIQPPTGAQGYCTKN